MSSVAPVLIIARRLGRERSFLVSLGRGLPQPTEPGRPEFGSFSVASAVAVFVGMVTLGDRLAPTFVIVGTPAPMMALGTGTLRAVIAGRGPQGHEPGSLRRRLQTPLTL